MSQSDAVVRCESVVTRVVVHARGALVERAVTLPEGLPDGELVLVIGGLPQGAAPASLRAAVLSDGRELVAVQARAALGEAQAPARELRDALARATRARDAQRVERQAIERERARIIQLAPAPDLKAREPGALGAPLRVTLAIGDALDARLDALDARLASLDASLREADAARDACALALSQASQQGAEDRALEARVTLRGEGAITQLTVSYTVEAARWWPRYTLRLSDGARRASLSMEAMVTQDSGEDWPQIALSLSTAKLTQDARLPELPSLRLGKIQPQRPSGFRAPPDGLDRLFAPYDEALRRAARTAPEPEPKPAPMPSVPMPRGGMVPAQPVPQASYARAPELVEDEASIAMFDGAPMPSRASLAMDQDMMRAPKSKSGARSRGGLGAALFSGEGGGAMPPPAPRAPAAPAMAREESAAEIEHISAPTTPQDEWLHFERLVLAGADGPTRGKLRVSPARHVRSGDLHEATSRARTQGLVDPLDSRGHYDHRYEATGRLDLPCDGQLHRLEICAATTGCALRWRAIPLESDEVFRLVNIINPLDGPLLGGPVDVFVEGSFLLTDTVAHVDRGGALTLGLGVDERLRVARNVRVQEQVVGLLNNKSAIEHHITLNLASSLGFDAEVELLDRLPVSDDDDIHIEQLDASPQPEPYLRHLGVGRLRGGLRWLIKLSAGQQRVVTLSYRVTLPAKQELIGGNRRD